MLKDYFNRFPSLARAYFKRITTMPSKAELVFWWVLRLLMIGGMVYTAVMYFTEAPYVEGGFNPCYKYNIATQTYERSLYNVLQMGANFVGMFVYEICQLFPRRRFPRHLPTYLQNITIIGFLLASFGGAFLNFYYVIPAYDKILHLTGCVEAVFVGYEIITAMQVRSKWVCSGRIAALAAFGVAFVFAAGWELFEFTTDQWFGFDAQHWSYLNAIAESHGETLDDVFMILSIKHFSPEEQKMRFAIMDTMGDAILNALGAIPMYIFLRKRPYHHIGEKNVNKKIEAELAKSNKKEVTV